MNAKCWFGIIRHRNELVLIISKKLLPTLMLYFKHLIIYLHWKYYDLTSVLVLSFIYASDGLFYIDKVLKPSFSIVICNLIDKGLFFKGMIFHLYWIYFTIFKSNLFRFISNQKILILEISQKCKSNFYKNDKFLITARIH